MIFGALELLPGDVAEVMLGPTAAPEQVEALRRELGLDRPALQRWLAWLAGFATGDLGTSVAYGVPVAGLLAERAVVSLPLALLAMALTTLAALGLGVLAAVRRGRAADTGVMLLSQLGLAVPNFWLAILLILLFAVQWRWLPAGGFPGWRAEEGGGLAAGLGALLLPALALAAVQAAVLARITRSAVLDTLHEDYVRTARAKGAGPARVLLRHVLRNAAIPIVTVMGLQFANLVTGAIVVENVFQLPGLGRLVFQAIANRDLVVVRNVVMLFAGFVIALNFAVDLLQLAIDPRLRRRSAEGRA